MTKWILFLFLCLAAAAPAAASDRDRYDELIRQGDRHLAEKTYAPAIESYREAVTLIPSAEPARIALAEAYRQSELFELARQELLAALKKNRNSFPANFALGKLYQEQGLMTQAIEYFRRALTLKSDVEVYRCLAACAENEGDLDLAVAMLKQTTSLCRQYEDIVALGRLYRAQGKYKDAEYAFSQAVAVDPSQADGYLLLAILYFENNQMTPAEKLFEVVKEKFPGEALPCFFLANLAARNGDLRRAKAELEAADRLARSPALKEYGKRMSAYISGGKSGK